MQEFYTLFDYNFLEGPKINLLDINMIRSKYGISIDQTDNTMKTIIQAYWVTNTKDKVKLQQRPFTMDT